MMDAEWTCSLDELAKATGGQIRSRVAEQFSRVATDSRSGLKGRLFIPLRGDKFDAHEFIPQAIKNGAAVILVSELKAELKPYLERTSFVEVGDTLKGLQDLARAWRRRHGFKVIGITGSNGKTSTKEFLLSLLKNNLAVHASKGSFNNHWGVPLSILEADASQTHLILEMGMNHAGELTELCRIAEPDVVTVTSVGVAHIGELGSAEAVARAKEEIYGASPNAVHVFNMDNEWTMPMRERSSSKQILFSSFNAQADVHLRALRMTWDGLEISGRIGQDGPTQTVWVQTLGRHNVVNLMAASALALAVGLTPETIWRGLAELRDVTWGRNQLLKLKTGARLLWDGYNANPDSMGALMKNLFEMDVTGRKSLIVGDMRELGTFSEAAHEELGERAAGVGFKDIWFIGAFAEAFRRGLQKSGAANTQFQATSAIDANEADKFLRRLGPEDLVAIKASRGLALERVFAGWPLATPLGPKP